MLRKTSTAGWRRKNCAVPDRPDDEVRRGGGGASIARGEHVAKGGDVDRQDRAGAVTCLSACGFTPNRPFALSRKRKGKLFFFPFARPPHRSADKRSRQGQLRPTTAGRHR